MSPLFSSPLFSKLSRIPVAAGLATAAIVMAATPAIAARQSGEQELAELLKDRVPGKPVDCISLNEARNSRIIEGTAIVYDNGRTIWVNRPSGANWLHRDDIIVHKTSLSQVCKLDIVNLLDQGTHMSSGTVGLEQFVPYRRKG